MSNRLLFHESALRQGQSPFPSPRTLLWPAVRQAWRRYHSRQRIANLDSHLLRDIGVSFAEAEVEANKPFWRA
jgi:uncharacterized protein YjiS (DUF1127 family)